MKSWLVPQRKSFSQPPFWELDAYRTSLFGGSMRNQERIENDFEGYATQGYKSNGIVFGCIDRRQQVFSQARFQWRRYLRGQPQELFGTPELSLLERPWPNGTTGELLSLMEIDASLAGNFYATTVDERGRVGSNARGNRRIARMRPDWVTLIIDAPSGDPYGVDARVVGYEFLPRTDSGRREPLLLLPGEVCHYCVDEQTEILTAEGWKTVDTLQAGVDALTLNHETGMAEWQPVLEVCEFPAQSRTMLSMEGREHSSLTTLNHRWAVERKNSRAGRYERRWATSETLSSGDRIPVAALAADLPTQPKHTDALVEAVAWFWTEGCIKRRKNGTLSRAVSISQSVVVNEENTARIRASLRSVFGEPLADNTLSHRVPRWQETRTGDNAIFRLSSAAGDVLTEHAPAKVVTTAFLRSLTQAQLDLFIKVSLLADNAGPNRLAQKNRAAAEQFALACVLAGHGVSIRQRRVDPKYGYGMWSVRILKNRHIYPQESRREKSAFRSRLVTHEGRVWCPRTENQTWLARRNGAVYFTGNSPKPDPTARFRGMSWLTPIIDEVAADKAATKHKRKFFQNGANPSMAISFPQGTKKDDFLWFVEKFKAEHQGVENAYKTLFLTGGADPKPLSMNFRQLDFKITQGAGETRVAVAAGIPAVILGISEGLQGSSLNTGNFTAARRLFVDTTLRDLWNKAAPSLQTLVTAPFEGALLEIDARNIPFLREDAKDDAEIRQLEAEALAKAFAAGFDGIDGMDAVVEWLRTGDLGRLLGKHSGAQSVQTQGSNGQNSLNGSRNGAAQVTLTR